MRVDGFTKPVGSFEGEFQSPAGNRLDELNTIIGRVRDLDIERQDIAAT